MMLCMPADGGQVDVSMYRPSECKGPLSLQAPCSFLPAHYWFMIVHLLEHAERCLAQHYQSHTCMLLLCCAGTVAVGF